jgi:alpha-glucosidase (family GH31 glycosyl hydrolase)
LAAAQDWTIKNTPTNGKVDVTLMAAGGLGDLFFLLGDKPTHVAKMYQTAIVGSPVLTPQWALGWNQCKYGYTKT